MKNIKRKYIAIGLFFLFWLTIFIVFIPYKNIPLRNAQEKSNLRSSDGEITIITPENKTYYQAMDGYYPATYGFENDEDGSDPVILMNGLCMR